MDNSTDFGMKLMAARKSAGYRSAKEFIATHKLSSASYYQHEAGTCIPRIQTIHHYCKLLNIGIRNLIPNYSDSDKKGDSFNDQTTLLNKCGSEHKKQTIMSNSTFGIIKENFNIHNDNDKKLLGIISTELGDLLNRMNIKIVPNKFTIMCTEIQKQIVALTSNFNVQQKLIKPMLLAIKLGLKY